MTNELMDMADQRKVNHKQQRKSKETKIIILIVIIVVVLLAVVYIILPMFAWSYMSNFMVESTSKSFYIPFNGASCINNQINVTIVNTGEDEIILEDFIVNKIENENGNNVGILSIASSDTSGYWKTISLISDCGGSCAGTYIIRLGTTASSETARVSC